MRTGCRCRLAAVILFVPVWSARSDTQTLTAAERAQIDSGRQVVVTEGVAGASWPRVTIYQFIAASPEDAAAVFTDYERHVTFLPNVLRSHISHVIDSATVEVDYTLRVPFVRDESYTVRDQLTTFVTDSLTGARGYRVQWTLVRAMSTKAVDGEAFFQAYGAGTLLTYRNLVVPGSRLAGLGFIRGRALREVAATVRSLAEQVVKQRTGDRALLDQQVSALRAITGSL
ncbi:MAG: hypothetical protein ACT4P6_07305 [Gemmatimonadaceae bacterium]